MSYRITVSLWLAALLCGLLMQVPMAQAMCRPASPLRHYSATGKFRLETQPGQHCLGILTKRQGTQYLAIWSKRLITESCPADALVSETGQFVVTLDEPCNAGRGPHVVAVYGQSGSHLRSYSLAQLLTTKMLAGILYVFDVGRVWRGDATLDEKAGTVTIIVLQRQEPDRSQFEGQVPTWEDQLKPNGKVVIDLKSGKIKHA